MFADAALQPGCPPDRCLRATIDLREDMGHEVFAYFAVNAPSVLTEDTRDLAEDRGGDAVAALEQEANAQRSNFVARFSSDSRVAEGDTIDVAVDTAKLHFFDPATGDAIWDRAAA
jgi:multiple sugar transport system ATP-binding protein